MRYRLHRPRYLRRGFRLRAKRHSSVMHIRAGDIHLDDIHLRRFVHPLAGIDIIVNREPAHICQHHALVQFPKPRQLMRHHMLHARILQAHRVQHAVAAALCNTRQRIAVPRLPCGAFERDTAQHIQVVQRRKLLPKPVCPRRRDNRISQFYIR